jgi:hypothetical protein
MDPLEVERAVMVLEVQEVTPCQEVQVWEFLLVEDSQGLVVSLVPQDSQEPQAAPLPKESPRTTILSGWWCPNGMVILTQSSIGFMHVMISSIWAPR